MSYFLCSVISSCTVPFPHIYSLLMTSPSVNSSHSKEMVAWVVRSTKRLR